MGKISLKTLLPVLPLFVCIEEGHARLFYEGNDGEYRVSDQDSASGHTESYSFLSKSFVSLLKNISRGILNTLFLLSLFVFAPAAVAGTYYVSTSGSNSNPGTISSPFGTLQKAHDIAVAGDTIYMRGGTYNITSGHKLIRSGASGNHIKVFAYPGEFPVIDASQMTQNGYVAGFPLSLVGASWWHIKGLEIKNGPEGGLVLYPNGSSGPGSSNNIIENNNVHHNGRLSQSGGTGIRVVSSSANNLILNNDSHHNRDILKDGADGFAIGGPGAGNVLRGNRAWRNSDDGYDFFNVIDNTNGGVATIEGNWAWENGYDDNLQPLGEGNGFKLGGQRPNTTSTSGGHMVKNNVSWKNKQHGFVENLAKVPMTVYNNTAWSNKGSNFLFNYLASTFRNNLSFTPGGNLISSTANNAYNSWNLPVTVSTADFASLDFTGATGPRNADGSLPTINLLRLVAGSDLIHKGVNVGIAYTGSAPDLGAYEYGGSDGCGGGSLKTP